MVNTQNKDRITNIVSDMEKYLSEIAGMRITKESLNDKMRFYAASMLLFSLINRSIDLGEEILSAFKLGMPSTYKDVFYILGREKLIGRETERAMSNLVRYRNLLSHEYSGITADNIIEAMKEIGGIEMFLHDMKKAAKRMV